MIASEPSMTTAASSWETPTFAMFSQRDRRGSETAGAGAMAVGATLACSALDPLRIVPVAVCTSRSTIRVVARPRWMTAGSAN